MINKLKVLAPFALFAMTLFSCGNNGLRSRIQRVQYAEITGEDKHIKVHSVIDDIFQKQTEPHGGSALLRRVILPNEGFINTTFEMDFSGSITHEELRMKDVNISSKTNYQMAWNLYKEYVEFRGDNKSWYVLRDSDSNFWLAYSYLVDDKETKERSIISGMSDQILANNIRLWLATRGGIIENVDVGISGLGYNTREYLLDVDRKKSIEGLFNDSTGVMYEIYDYLNERAGDGHSLNYKFATDGAGTFSGDLNAHLDLKTLQNNIYQNIPEEYREIIDQIFGHVGLSGNVDFDLFAAWANNYICQQEYIIRARDFYYADGSDSTFTEIKANADIYFGEEVSQQFSITDAQINQILADYPPKQTK